MQTSDCVAAGFDFHYPERIFFPVAMNGYTVHAMLDAASFATNMNLPAARAIGIAPGAQNVALIPEGDALQFMSYRGQKVWQVSTALPLTVGTHGFAPVQARIHEHRPRNFHPLPRIFNGRA